MDRKQQNWFGKVDGHKWAWIVACFIITIHICLAWSTHQQTIETSHDDAQYIALGRSLQQLSYRDIFLVGEPHHSMYPPGYPALLALQEVLFGPSYPVKIFFNILASAGALALIFSAAQRLYSSLAGLCSIVPLAVNPYLLEFSGKVSTESPYIFFSILALWLLIPGHSAKWVSLSGISAILTSFVRTIGDCLLLGMGLYFLFSKRFKEFIVFSVAVLGTAGLWLFWTFFAPEQYFGRSYVADAAKLVSRATGSDSAFWYFLEKTGNHIHYYVGLQLLDLMGFPTFPGTRIDNAIGLLVLGSALLLGLRFFYYNWTPACSYLIVYGLFLAIWIFGNRRFLLPVLPLLVMAAVIGGGEMFRMVRPHWSKIGMGGLGLILTINGVVLTAELVHSKVSCTIASSYPPPACLTPEQKGFFEGVQFIDAHLPPHVKILSSKPATLFYYTGHQGLSRGFVLKSGAESFLPLLYDNNVKYILIDKLHYFSTQVEPWVIQHCQWFLVEKEFSNKTYLLHLLDSMDSKGKNSTCKKLEKQFQG